MVQSANAANVSTVTTVFISLLLVSLTATQ